MGWEVDDARPEPVAERAVPVVAADGAGVEPSHVEGLTKGEGGRPARGAPRPAEEAGRGAGACARAGEAAGGPARLGE